VSGANTEPLGAGSIEAHRLLEAATRLKELRRRFVTEPGDEKRVALTRDHLESIIADLDGWLRPGGRSVAITDLGLRLGVLREMFESAGFPAYAHIVDSIRRNIVKPVGGADSGNEPPPPRRYEPPPARIARRSTSAVEMDEWETRAAAERPQGRSRWVAWSVLIGGILAAAALLVLWPRDTGRGSPDPTVQVAREEPGVMEPTAAPSPTKIPNAADLVAEEEIAPEILAQLVPEIDFGHGALHDRDTGRALQHLVAAAAIDRHDHRVKSLAGSVIGSLLREAGEAFDDGDWELSADRVELARQIARGLHLDSTVIEETAQKLAIMTHFEDVTPENRPAFSRAVGRAVRVTTTDGEVLFGRLEAFENDSLMLEVHSGVEGGGVAFSKLIAVEAVRQLRVFEAERISDIVLGPGFLPVR
jgi:hypothetical protein